MRKKKRRLPVRAAALILMLIGIFSVITVAAIKISDGSAGKAVLDRLSSFLSVKDPTFGNTEKPPEQGATSGDISAVLPSPGESGDEGGGETEPPNGTSSGNETVGTEEADKKPPAGAVMIVDAASPDPSHDVENMTVRKFDVDLLYTMKTAVPKADGGPLCLIIHTHATESFMQAGASFFDPSVGELARSTNDSENVTAVGKVLSDLLNQAGIPTLHVTVHHDEDGAGKAYVSSKSTVEYYLSRYPSIKYVFDLHRSGETDEDGNILRDSVNVGGSSLARIRITVSGGSSLSDAGVCSNLALALQLRDVLCDYSSSLVRPVLISDAIYCDGYAPRTLKIDIGSCASTLTEAKESAKVLGEALIYLFAS